MKLDRQLQKDLLTFLRDNSPNFTSINKIHEEFGESASEQLFYLAGHELVSLQNAYSLPKRGFGFSSAMITSKGIDFIEQDGGLSAILDKVTFKLDEEQFNDILALAVEQSAIPQDQKPALKKALETANHATITSLITNGINALTTNAPALLNQLTKVI